MAKVDLPSGDNILLGKMQRKDFLYNKFDKTAAENTELASLQAELANYGITANDWNTLQQQVTDGFNGVTSTVNTAITNHKAETDPHPQYAMDSDLSSKLNVSAYTSSDVLSKLLTVDGAGSGVDADTLDGLQGSAYALKPVTGTYTGDGAASRDIALPFTPSAVYLNPKTGSYSSYAAGLALNGFPNGGSTDVFLQIGTNKITVCQVGSMRGNESGIFYHYIAFP